MDLEVRADVLLPLRAPRGDFAVPRVERWNLSGGSLGEQLAQEGACIGQDAEIGHVIAADLRVVHVDVHQLRRREIPRIARHPGGSRTVVEARADRDHQIGVPARLVGRISAITSDEAQR